MKTNKLSALLIAAGLLASAPAMAGDARLAMVYRLQDGQIVGVKDAGGLSPMDASTQTREAEAIYARSWFKNIISDIYG